MDDGDCAKRYEQYYFKVAMAAQLAKQIKKGSFMFCQDCGQPIPLERRIAVGGCTRCVSCQRQVEQHGR